MATFQTTIYQSTIVDGIFRYDIEADSVEEAKQKAQQIVENGITCDEKDGFVYFQWDEANGLNPNGTTEISIANDKKPNIIISHSRWKQKP